MQQIQRKVSFIFIFILGILAMLPPMAIDLYLPAFLDISKDLNVNTEQVQKTLALFTMGFAIGQIIWGPIADSFGRKPAILIGTLLAACCEMLLTQVSDIDHFLFLRFVEGIVGAAPAVILGALVKDLFTKNEFSKMMSIVMLISMLAPLLAPLIGGYLVIFFHWHAIFYVLAFMGFLSFLLVYWKVPETLALENRQPFTLSQVKHNFISLIRVKVVVGYVLCAAFSFAGFFAFLTSGSIVYIDIYGIATEHFGYFFILNMLAMIVFTMINTKMVVKLGAEYMLRLGLAVQLFAGVWLLIVAILGLGFWPMVIGIVAYVSTMSIVGSNSMACILDRFPQYTGTANSLAGTMRFGIAAIGGFLLSLVPVTSEIPMLLSIFLCILIGGLSYYFLSSKDDEIKN